jgi:hypothetical protein
MRISEYKASPPLSTQLLWSQGVIHFWHSITFLYFVCFSMHRCRAVMLVELIHYLYLFTWEPVGASVRLVTLKPGWKPQSGNPLVPQVLIFFVCGVLFEIDYNTCKPMLFPLLFDCVGRLCILNGGFWVISSLNQYEHGDNSKSSTYTFANSLSRRYYWKYMY